MRSLKRALLLAGGAVFSSGGVLAATVTANFDSAAPYQVVNATTDGALTSNSLIAGRLNWTRTGGDYAGLNDNFTSFCIEISEHISAGGSYEYQVVSPEFAPTALGGMGLAKADELSELFGRFYAGLDQSSADDMAAMQLAVWNIIYDDDKTVAAGTFQTTDGGSYFAHANSMLGAINGSGPHAPLMALAEEGAQDQLIPEPASLLLLAIGAAASFKRR